MTDKLTEAIDDAVGANDHSMVRSRPYSGQSHTDTGQRGEQEISGITFRDLRDACIRAWCMSGGADVEPNRTLYNEAIKGEDACLCENDVYALDASQGIDLIAVFQNLSCEVEKIMGIYPNVQRLQTLDDIPIIGSIDENGNFETE